MEDYLLEGIGESISQIMPQGIGNTPPPNPAVVGQAP
jgi:hypothetical protein